jgi:hypothetical protein
MNARFLVDGQDVTDAALLQATRINYDSTRHITTAAVTIVGAAVGTAAVWGEAVWGVDSWTVDIEPLSRVTILDGRDSSKLFEGRVYALDLKQTDAEQSMGAEYGCDLNDYAAFLDRAVCWDADWVVPFPTSDQILIQRLVGHFCPQVNAYVSVAQVLPVIMAYDWVGKTCREALDDIAALSLGTWYCDFDGVLHYGAASDAPGAPYALSTSPDYLTTFPVRVDSYKRDFTNPINRCFVRGGYVPGAAVRAEAEFSDPVSIEQFGEYSYSITDDSLTNPYDCELRAKTTVLKYAWPLETGAFTVWTDDLAVGMKVHIREESLGIDGDYVIQSLALVWKDQHRVEYAANFGSAKPNLESYLRLLDQRSRWKSAAPVSASPLPGSVSDSSIAPGGLHSESIAAVSAGAITGQIVAAQIGAVSAGVIVGQIQSGQIGSVNAGSVTGALQAGQIGSVNATTIQGVIVSSQVADGLIDNLSKYSAALRPIPTLSAPPALPNATYPPNSFFYNESNGHFYQVTADGAGYTDQGTSASVTGSMAFYHIGKISAGSITGLIAAAQIGSITAGQITGMIQAAQIAAVNASTIQGTITADHIGGVSANLIQGAITAGQIGSIDAATITIGLVGDAQIGTVSGGKLIVGTVSSDKLNATEIKVGGGGSKPGKFTVCDAGGATIGQIGQLSTGNYGGWFKLFGAGGSDYSSAKVYTDVGGSLFIRDADLSISGSYGTLSTSPTTFDSTYTSIALKATYGSDYATFISRGIVCYSSSSMRAALVRSPSDANAGEMTLYYGTTLVIHANGADRTIRAESGYKTGTGSGTVVLNASGQFVGPSINTAGVAKADGGFQCQTYTGQNTAVQVTATNGQKVTLTWTGGILTSAVVG